jgi:hypothetical protein
MANDIKCTCGHSWSKASSSKKDMYVCHICGKDNTMEDGGWLSKFEQGGMNLEQKGDNYGKKPNPNDVQASVGPDFVGLGYDITGRNYSPAWGGQFEDGGYIAQGGTAVPTTADSLALYNNSKKVLDYYRGKNYKNSNIYDKVTYDERGNMIPIDGSYNKYSKKGYYQPLNEKALSDFIKSGMTAGVPTKQGNSKRMAIPLSAYYKKLDDNRYFQREGFNQLLDTRSPMQLFDKRITPTIEEFYENVNPQDSLFGDGVSVLSYDPVLIKPVSMLTSEERALRLKRYGKESGLVNKKTSTEKSKTEPVKQSSKKEPIVVNDPKDPRLKAYNDSLKLSQTFPRWDDWADLNNSLVKLNGKAPTIVNTKEGLRGVKKPVQPVVYKKSEREPIIVNDPKDPKLKAYQDSLNLYNKNKKLYESGIETKPKGLKYENAIKGENYGDRFYLKEGTPIDVVKKPTQLVKYETPKVEVKVTPKGSKKYIVNGMEVSEEDFLGSGATTGGGKRVIYNTPNRGTQKVLRLDGTPETDPDKIRRALATANKNEMAMGGSLPGAVGFTYARVAGSAPSNGKYAKKTKASAQNGKEMKFYQEGLDFKPNSIAQEGAIVDPMGQWAHPGEVTIIPDTNITMEGVDYPVLGISDTGDQQMMYPGEDYNFDGEYVTEYPMMQDGGWLSKYQEKAPSDATRVVAPIRPLTKKEQEENVRVNKQTQKRTEELNKAIVAERKSKRETKGDVNIPGSFNISEKLKLSNVLPVSWAPPGGAVDIFDEYLNPGTVIGPLADSLGESIAARSPEDIAATLAMTLGAGALGFDPLGSALKSPTLKMATKELSDVARTIRDIPRAGSVKEAIGRVGGIPLRKDIPRMATQDVKALRQVQEIGRLRATNSPMADQMKYGLENNLPEEHFQKVFGKSKEEAQNLLNSGFGEQEAAKSANIRSSIDLRRNRGSDLDLDRSIANRPINGQQPGTPEHNALLQEINSYQNPRQSVDRSERINELLQQATQPIADSRYRSLSSDEILNNFNRNYTTETKMTGSMKNFDRKLNNLVYKNIQDYPYYSGEVLQKVPSLNLSGSGSLKDVSKKVGFAPEGISSGDVFTGSTNTSHSSWLPQIKQVFKYDKGTPQFLGYQPMNSLGFLSNYGYDEKDIAKYLNSEIDEQIKRGVIPKNVSRPFQKGEHVMLPQYGVRQNKNGGWLNKYK